MRAEINSSCGVYSVIYGRYNRTMEEGGGGGGREGGREVGREIGTCMTVQCRGEGGREGGRD